MTTPLSERMLSAAQQCGIEPPSDLEDLVVLFGRGIGDRAIFNDLDSGMYRGIKEKFNRDHVLEMLRLILEVDVILELVVERSLQAHRYVRELDDGGGNASALRMVAHMNLEPEQMKTSVFHAVNGLRNNLSKLNW